MKKSFEPCKSEKKLQLGDVQIHKREIRNICIIMISTFSFIAFSPLLSWRVRTATRSPFSLAWPAFSTAGYPVVLCWCPSFCTKGSCKHLCQSSPTKYQVWVRYFLPPYTLGLQPKMASKGLVVYSTTIPLAQCFMFIKACYSMLLFQHILYTPGLTHKKDPSDSWMPSTAYHQNEDHPDWPILTLSPQQPLQR